MVENCKESLKNGVLDRAVEALSNAGTVMFTGLGASAVGAMDGNGVGLFVADGRRYTEHA